MVVLGHMEHPPTLSKIWEYGCQMKDNDLQNTDMEEKNQVIMKFLKKIQNHIF